MLCVDPASVVDKILRHHSTIAYEMLTNRLWSPSLKCSIIMKSIGNL